MIACEDVSMLTLQIVGTDTPIPLGRDLIVLVEDDWNDWWAYKTVYKVWHRNTEGVATWIGTTKIGQRGLVEDDEKIVRPNLPKDIISALPSDAFSLGQSTEFYTSLAELGPDVRDRALRSLRDIAYNPELRSEVANLDVTRRSLMRDVSKSEVSGQFHRIAHGGEVRTDFDFSFLPLGSNMPIDFVVEQSTPPTNIHVLVGRNGVGKSTILNDMALCLKEFHESGSNDPFAGTFIEKGSGAPRDPKFSNVVTISFSAFDSLNPVYTQASPFDDRRYIEYVGLRKLSPSDDGLKGMTALTGELTKMAKNFASKTPDKKVRWQHVIGLLENDPMFAQTNLTEMISKSSEDEIKEALPKIFKRLSSGHKIVLLSLTKLVEHVEEKTLVLIDEPEAHLHPPLLSAYVRALAYLLTNRNGVAVVATHSPVVLQEVPRSCVWMLSRSGNFAAARRPKIESFGENVGTLTNEVFGLEVTATGFHKLLTDAIVEYGDYESALQSFSNQVGLEGRSILRSRTYSTGRQDI